MKKGTIQNSWCECFPEITVKKNKKRKVFIWLRSTKESTRRFWLVSYTSEYHINENLFSPTSLAVFSSFLFDSHAFLLSLFLNLSLSVVVLLFKSPSLRDLTSGRWMREKSIYLYVYRGSHEATPFARLVYGHCTEHAAIDIWGNIYAKVNQTLP